jgi:cysteine-rich repeat protein
VVAARARLASGWLGIALLGALPGAASCGTTVGSADSDGEETIDRGADGATDVGTDWADPDHGELPPLSCGNGTVDPGEECDDGNRMNGDGCDWACRLGNGEFDAGAPDPDAGRLVPDAEVARVDPGVVADGTAVMSFVDEIPLEWTGEAYATVWPWRSSDGASRATFIRFDTAGTRLGGGWTYDDFGEVWEAFDLAWGGSTFGLCLGGRADGSVMFVVLDEDGKPRSDPFMVGTYADRSSPFPPIPLRVIADGGYSCAWPGLDLVRLQPDGRDREDGQRSLADLLPDSTSVAWSGSSYLVTWAGWSSAGESVARYLVLDDNLAPFPGAGVLGPIEELTSALNVRGVWLGDRFGIAWPVAPPGAAEDPDGVCTIHVAFVDRYGELLGPPVPEPDSYAHLSAYVPAAGLAAGGGAGSIAVAVLAAVPAAGTINLRLLRFDRNGAFIELVELADVPGSALVELRGPLGVAFDGNGFGVIAQPELGSSPAFFRWSLLR